MKDFVFLFFVFHVRFFLWQEGCTVLYRAANYGQADMVAELLKRSDIKVNLATVVCFCCSSSE